jgi:predicted Zn-dependent protease
MKNTKLTHRTPAIPLVPPAPSMWASLAVAAERLLLLADGAAAEAAAAVKAGRLEEAQHRLDQAAAALSLARRAEADVEDRRRTLSSLRAVVEEIQELTA